MIFPIWQSLLLFIEPGVPAVRRQDVASASAATKLWPAALTICFGKKGIHRVIETPTNVARTLGIMIHRPCRLAFHLPLHNQYSQTIRSSSSVTVFLSTKPSSSSSRSEGIAPKHSENFPKVARSCCFSSSYNPVSTTTSLLEAPLTT